jgi:hypothetical protein
MPMAKRTRHRYARFRPGPSLNVGVLSPGKVGLSGKELVFMGSGCDPECEREHGPFPEGHLEAK